MIDLLVEVLELDSLSSPFPRAFVEFGVENYREANTRFLLTKRHWQGLVMDGSAANIAQIRRDPIHYRHDLEAQCHFITRDNIDSLISAWLKSRNLGNVALLSVDIDGVDYFVWEAICCIRPAVVVVEYNALFGEKSVTVPYRADFNRFKARFSGLYFGASLAALKNLGARKGYRLVGCDKSATNAFFVLENLAPRFAPFLSAKSPESFPHFVRQSRDERGVLSFLGGQERTAIIAHLPLEEVL